MAVRREVRVVVVYLIVLASLSLVQITFDKLREKKKPNKDTLWFPDNLFAGSVATYNACTSPSLIKTLKQKDVLPLAYQTFPPPHVDPCRLGNPGRSNKSLFSLPETLCRCSSDGGGGETAGETTQ